MYAIVEIAGQQFRVEKQQKIFVHRLNAGIGDSVDFEKVLLLETDDNILVGTPTVPGAVVSARVLEHVKGDKVLVFKKKRRKGYQKMTGHRQLFTRIEVDEIAVNGVKKTEAPAKSKKTAAEKDDLRKIEGIGPKIAEILNNSGINTYAELAAADPDKIREILAEKGSRYAVHNPSTWPKQSQLAAEGKWDELKDLQESLKGGVE